MFLYSVPKTIPWIDWQIHCSLQASSKCFVILMCYLLNSWRITIRASRVSSPNWLLSFVANNPIAEKALSGSRLWFDCKKGIEQFLQIFWSYFSDFRKAHFFLDNATFNFVLNFSSVVPLFNERSKLFTKCLWPILLKIVRNLHYHFSFFCASLMKSLCNRDGARAVIFVFQFLISKWSWFSSTKSGFFKYFRWIRSGFHLSRTRAWNTSTNAKLIDVSRSLSCFLQQTLLLFLPTEGQHPPCKGTQQPFQ